LLLSFLFVGCLINVIVKVERLIVKILQISSDMGTRLMIEMLQKAQESSILLNWNKLQEKWHRSLVGRGLLTISQVAAHRRDLSVGPINTDNGMLKGILEIILK
jgi:hypothetical protein